MKGTSVVVDVPHEYWKLLADAKSRRTQNIPLIFVIKHNDRQVSHLERKFQQTTLDTYQHRISGQLTLKTKQFQIPSIVSDHIEHIEGLSKFPVLLNTAVPKHPLANKAQSNAPIIISLTPNEKNIEFFIELKCSNGKIAYAIICPEFEGYKVTLRTLGSTTSQTVSLANANCRFYTLQYIVFCRFVLTFNIRKYQQNKISIQSKFVENGQTSYSASVSKEFEEVSKVTPSLLSSLYNVNTSTLKQKRHAKSRQAVVGFSNYYNLKSFTAFAQSFGKNFNLKIGKVYGTDYKNKSYHENETSLDMEYMAAMGAGIVTDYISGSTYDYDFTQFFATLAMLESNKRNVVPLVYSISYATDERAHGAKGVRMIDINFMKMGVSGKTVFAASGDNGVWAQSGACPKRFGPVYASSSPYITSVGGTQLIHGVNGSCRYISQESGICLEEIVAYKNALTNCLITSGGGFSEYHSTPTWQKPFVQNYLTSAG
ncbi:unnamed protein product, partial [Didymodactylos carnosus]